MLIISSTASVSAEAGDRIRVDETHTDDDGLAYLFTYLAPKAFDVASRLAARAADLPAVMAANEIRLNVFNVSILGAAAPLSFKYSTRQDNGLALQAEAQKATNAASVMIGDFVANADAEATLELTKEQVAQLKTDVLTSVSEIADAIKGVDTKGAALDG